MVAFVLNIRADQVHPQGGAVRLPKIHHPVSSQIYGEQVLLFAPRDERKPGYFGTATIGECVPDLASAQRFWLRIFDMHLFDHPATLSALRAFSEMNDETPFHLYSHPIRQISEWELKGLRGLGLVRPGFGEGEQEAFNPPTPRSKVERIRRRALRFEMLDLYGPNCVFSNNIFPTLDGLGSGVDTGHLQPLWLGGADIIQNVMPMTKDVNHLWDSGIISLTNAGRILIASKASDDAKSLVAGRVEVRFPASLEFWPKAEFLERHRDEVFETGRNGRGFHDL